MTATAKQIKTILGTQLDRRGAGISFNDFVKNKDYNDDYIVLTDIIRKQGFNPQALGTRFEDRSVNGVFETNGVGYGIGNVQFDKKTNELIVFVRDTTCLPDTGDCGMSCDGFEVARKVNLEPHRYSLVDCVASEGFEVGNEEWKKCNIPSGLLPEFLQEELDKEQASVLSKLSKHAYNYLCNNSDVAICNDDPYFNVQGDTIIIHPEDIKNIDFATRLRTFLQRNGLKSPTIIDTGLLQNYVEVSNDQRGANFVEGTVSGSWAKLDIVDAVMEFVGTADKSSKFIAYDAGSIWFANYNKFDSWQDVPRQKDYYRGAWFYNRLPMTVDLGYIRKCSSEFDDTAVHCFKMQTYPLFVKRPNTCSTKSVDVLKFEVRCYDKIDICTADTTCNDITVSTKEHQSDVNSITIPASPVMASEGTVTGGTLKVYNELNNYGTLVEEYEYVDFEGGTTIENLEAGNHKLVYDVDVMVGELTCTKRIELIVCVLDCNTPSDGGDIAK